VSDFDPAAKRGQRKRAGSRGRKVGQSAMLADLDSDATHYAKSRSFLLFPKGEQQFTK
jgi:hypothetical protein